MRLFKLAKKLNKKYGFGSEPPSFLAPEEEPEDSDLSEFGGGYSEWGAEPPSFVAPSEKDVSWEDEPTISTSHIDLKPDELSLIKALLDREIGEDEAKGEDTEQLQSLTEKIKEMLGV